MLPAAVPEPVNPPNLCLLLRVVISWEIFLKPCELLLLYYFFLYYYYYFYYIVWYIFQDGTGIPLHFWGVFDGHAGSGAAIMASKLLHRLIRDRLGEICHLLENPTSVPPICLAKNGSPYQVETKKGAAQEPEDPDAISDSSVRFHMEKVVSLESLVMGVIETAFTQMVSRWWLTINKQESSTSSCMGHICTCVSSNSNFTSDFNFNSQNALWTYCLSPSKINYT